MPTSVGGFTITLTANAVLCGVFAALFVISTSSSAITEAASVDPSFPPPGAEKKDGLQQVPAPKRALPEEQQTPALKDQWLREGEKKLDEHVKLVGDVLAAAATNATQLMQTLDHHANLLAILYGVAAGIFVFGGIVAGWIGVGQFDRLKNDLRQSLETECGAMRRELDLAREQVRDILSWHREARQRVEQRINMWDTRFKQIDVIASLSAKHSECYALGVIYDAVVQRGNDTESSVPPAGGSKEVPPILRSGLERIITISSHCLTQVSAHGQGDQAHDFDAAQWYNVFRTHKAKALVRLGEPGAALKEMERCLVVQGLSEAGEATLRYNTACYACLDGDERRALDELKLAVALNRNYKAVAKGDPQLRTLLSNSEFQRITT